MNPHCISSSANVISINVYVCMHVYVAKSGTNSLAYNSRGSQYSNLDGSVYLSGQDWPIGVVH